MRRSNYNQNLALVLLLVVLSLLLPLPPCHAIEAKWTPADGGGEAGNGGDGGDGADGGGTGGPLPLSQNQRDQLLSLEDAIVNSPNPQDTLIKIAEGNDMSPRELVDLLERNRADMEAAGVVQPRGGGPGGGGMRVGGNTLPRRILGLVLSLLSALGKAARSHPQTFAILLSCMMLSLYATVQAPRTGIVMSTGPNALLLSGGHSTFFVPPAKYVTRYMESTKFCSAESSISKRISGRAGSLSRLLVEELSGEEDGQRRDMLDGTVFVKAGGRKSSFGLAVVARRTVDVSSLVPELGDDAGAGRTGRIREGGDVNDQDDDEEDDNVNEDDEVDERTILLQEATDATFDAALTVLSSRRFTEFASVDDTDQLVRFQSTPSSSGDGGSRRAGGGVGGGAVLVVKSMGDFGRYGLQPLRVAHQEESTDSASVIYYTVKGGHFDGEIRLAVGINDGLDDDEGEGDEDDDRAPSIVITVNLVVPKKGRKVGKKYAERIVSTIADSMATSVTTQAKQSLARRNISSRYRGRVSTGASERRQIRFDNERKMEEMAEDRRRRWQRRNPDAGRYRPSGDRMRSPNNC